MFVCISDCISSKQNSSKTVEYILCILIKLYTVVVYLLRMCKENNPGLKNMKGDNFCLGSG